MIIQSNNQWYKLATEKDLPGLDRPIAVFKRMAAFDWEQLDVHFDSKEDAVEFIKFESIL